MEQFNTHKLVNLRKRFDKYDCDCAAELRAVIDKHMVIQKAISVKKTQQKKDEYQSEKVDCPYCDKEQFRHYLYKHKQSCGMKPTRMKKPAKSTAEDDLIKKHMDKIKAEFPLKPTASS
jgi:hypothetical protein